MNTIGIDYKQIGKRIANRRHTLGLTQAELAEHAGMSATYTGNIERGAKCSIETLMKLCQALDVTPDFLLIGVNKDYHGDTQEEINDLIHQCDFRKKRMIVEYIKWYANQEID